LTAGLGEIHVDNASAHVSHWHNPSRPHDVNQDRSVTPIDALLVVNTLNAGGARALSAAEGEANALVDVNGDSQITPADCLEVVNELNQDPVAGATVDEASSDDLPVTEVPVDDGTVDDGTVDDGTVDAVPAGHHGCDDSPPSPIADLLARADANEDGGLTKDELPSQLWDRLSSADTDGDGSITLDELIAFTPERGPHSPRHDGNGGGDAFDRFDQNDDGLLTEDELPERLWDRIAPADTDGDGALSAEELTTYRPAPPPREGTSPTGLTVVSSTVVPQEHGPAPHRGGGSRAMMPLGGSLRRV
jgi:hypothetical protein